MSNGAKEASLTLTGEFELVADGRRLAITHMAERVLAYLALADRPVSRTKLSGVLWLDVQGRRAANNLRTALWRLHHVGKGLVITHDNRLLLSPAVAVDVTQRIHVAKRLIEAPETSTSSQLALLVDCDDLLPDWDDEWVIADRERFRLLRLEALEQAAASLIDRARFSDALIVAEAAVRCEPLRESVRRLVVQAHLAQGNAAEAIRCFQQYRAMLRDEFAVEPSRGMYELMEPLHTSLLTTA